MQVHIWPSRTLSVAAPSAAISVHASWVASWVGTGTVWKWSKTQIDSKGLSSLSASWAMLSIVGQWSLGSIPTRSSRQPCGTKSPKRMAHHPNASEVVGYAVGSRTVSRRRRGRIVRVTAHPGSGAGNLDDDLRRVLERFDAGVV